MIHEYLQIILGIGIAFSAPTMKETLQGFPFCLFPNAWKCQITSKVVKFYYTEEKPLQNEL